MEEKLQILDYSGGSKVQEGVFRELSRCVNVLLESKEE